MVTQISSSPVNTAQMAVVTSGELKKMAAGQAKEENGQENVAYILQVRSHSVSRAFSVCL